MTLKRGVGGQPGTSGLSVLEHFRLAGILQGLRSLWQLMRQLCVPQQLSLHGRQSAPVSAVAARLPLTLVPLQSLHTDVLWALDTQHTLY